MKLQICLSTYSDPPKKTDIFWTSRATTGHHRSPPYQSMIIIICNAKRHRCCFKQNSWAGSLRSALEQVG